jgi:hypothetical protein
MTPSVRARGGAGPHPPCGHLLPGGEGVVVAHRQAGEALPGRAAIALAPDSGERAGVRIRDSRPVFEPVAARALIRPAGTFSRGEKGWSLLTAAREKRARRVLMHVTRKRRNASVGARGPDPVLLPVQNTLTSSGAFSPAVGQESSSAEQTIVRAAGTDMVRGCPRPSPSGSGWDPSSSGTISARHSKARRVAFVGTRDGRPGDPNVGADCSPARRRFRALSGPHHGELYAADQESGPGG